MANVITIDSGGVRLGGNYASHTRGQNVGEVLDLTKVTGAFKEDQFWGPKGPIRVYVVNIGETGNSMSIVPGADNLHWLLVIYSGVATEFGAGVYSAGLLADLDIYIEASGRRFD